MAISSRFYDMQLLEQEIAASLHRALESGGDTFAYSLDLSRDAEALTQLAEMMDRYKSREYKQVVFLKEQGRDLASILVRLMRLKEDGSEKNSKSQTRNQYEVILRVLHDVMVQKELKRRRVDVSLCSGLRDG